MPHVQRLNHIGLTVRDIDASLAFWRDALGLRELGRGVVEWEHLDRIVGLEGTTIEWAELEFPGGAVSSSSGTTGRPMTRCPLAA